MSRYGLALLCGAASLAGAATAQEQPPAANTAPAVAASGLGDVVVTARRRAENLEKVPVSVTAFTGRQIAQKGITDKTSLADFTPSMVTITGGYPSEFAYFALRGQGPAFGVTPGVIPYFAEVANPVGVDGRVGTYFDLASVQVLAGPQGTLFGKNATGGNILFEPQRPTDRFEGYVQGEYGNYNDRRAEGAVNIPIVGDKVDLRVAGEFGQRDGYTEDVGPHFPGRRYDNLNYDSGRVSLIVRPTDRLEFYSVARYYYSDNNGPGTVLEQLNPATVATYGGFFPGLSDALSRQQSLGVRKVSYDLAEFSKTQYWQFINHADYRLNDDVSLHNIVSYSQFRDYYAYDYDATPFQLGGQSSSHIPVLAPNYLTEEFRIQGKAAGGALDYTAGVYYDDQTWSGPAGIEDAYQLPVSLILGPVSALYVEESSSHAVFGQATLNVGDEIPALAGLSITGGLRYTWERFHETAQIIAPPALGGTYNSQYPSYTVDIDQAVGQVAHVYVAVRDAFKSGGVNAGLPVGSPFATFPPEELQDVEVGVKSQFEVGGVPARLNLDAYHGDYSNIQRTVQEDVGGIELNVDQSAAKAVIQGVEFTGAVVPFKGLTLNASYSYIDSRYTKVAASAEGILAGSAFPYTPRNKLALGVSYETDLGERLGTLSGTLNYTYQDEFSTAQTNQSQLRYLPAYSYLNAQLGLRNVGGRPVDVTLFVDNLTNATYATGDADFYNTPMGAVTYTYAPPRMFGVRLRYQFGG